MHERMLMAPTQLLLPFTAMPSSTHPSYSTLRILHESTRSRMLSTEFWFSGFLVVHTSSS